jgi:hypothetical protein
MIGSLDRNIFEEPVEFNLDFAPTTFHWPERVSADEVVVENLTRMVRDATNPEIRRVWTNKLEEFKRKLRWGVLGEFPVRAHSSDVTY